MFALELIKKAHRKAVTKAVCILGPFNVNACLSLCVHSLLNPGPECADYQPLQ